MTSEMSSAVDRCPFFEAFQPKHIEKVIHLGTEVQFAKDEVIFHQEDEGTKFYVILSGRVALEARFAGKLVQIQTAYAGDELGWSAVLKRKMQFQARAMEPVQALAFDASQLLDACDSNPHFGRAFMGLLLALVAERLESTRLELAAALAKRDNQQ